jgi:nicotinate-nucleotide adenylyltransferase
VSEKRDLWVPILIAFVGAGLLAWDIAIGEPVLGAAAFLLGLIAAVACLPIRVKQGQGAVVQFGLGALLVLMPFSPAVLARLPDTFAWVVAGLGFLLPVRVDKPAARIALLAGAAALAVGAALGHAGLLPRRLVGMLLAGAVFLVAAAWRSRPRKEPPAPLGPRICVFGGTFDPFHAGHRALCEAALKVNERLLVVVAANPPHKEGERIERTDFHHRVAMARLGVEGLPRTEVLELEGRRAGPSYTVDTLDVIRKSHPPEARFRLLLGADMFQTFPTWHDWEGILDRVTLLVAPRPGCDLEPPPEFEGRNAPFEVLEAPAKDVSSTELRRLLHDGKEVGERLSPAVRAYVRDHDLYRSAASPKGTDPHASRA